MCFVLCSNFSNIRETSFLVVPEVNAIFILGLEFRNFTYFFAKKELTGNPKIKNKKASTF